MKYSIASFLSAFLMSSTAALACYPAPGFTYDEFRSDITLVVTARVSEVDIQQSGSSHCWTLHYRQVEYLYGAGPEAFSLTTCMGDIYQVDALSEEDEGFDYLGFIPDANVLIGLVEDNEGVSALRYAIPSCWGPMHMNLDKMPKSERAEFLQDVKDQIANTQ